LWEIATSEKLFPEFKQWKLFKKAITEDKLRPAIPDNIMQEAPGLVLLMNRCWAHDPNDRPSFAEILFRLDEILVVACIQDEAGRDFWKKHFLVPKQSLEETVVWGEFKEVLSTEVGVPPEDVKAVKKLLVVLTDEVHEKKKYVPISHFNQILHTFGFFFLPKQGPKILQEMKNLLEKDWFHGNIERSVAVQRLTSSHGGKEGTWLMRLRDPFDPKFPGHPFAISQIKDKQPIQRLIRFDPKKEKREFVIPVHGKDRAFGSLEELIQCPELKLRVVCDKNDEGGYLVYADQQSKDEDDFDVNPGI